MHFLIYLLSLKTTFIFLGAFFSIDWIKVYLAACILNFGIISYAYCKLMCHSLNSWDLSFAKSWHIEVPCFL